LIALCKAYDNGHSVLAEARRLCNPRWHALAKDLDEAIRAWQPPRDNIERGVEPLEAAVPQTRPGFWKRLFGGARPPSKAEKAFNTGCASCGGGSLAKVALQELNRDSIFSGTLLRCISCGRLFCDSSVILEDLRTLQPLRTWVEDATQEHPASLPRAAFVHADPSPPRTTVYKCILGRPFHSEIGMKFIRSILWNCILIPNTLKHRTITERLSIEIDGCSEDKREIWQIPELTSFFYMLHDQVPAIEFWLTADSLKVFLKTATAGIPQNMKRDILQLSAAINATMKNEMNKQFDGVSDELQLARWLMTESSAKAESFLKSEFQGKDDVVRSIQAESELYKARTKAFNVSSLHP